MDSLPILSVNINVPINIMFKCDPYADISEV